MKRRTKRILKICGLLSVLTLVTFFSTARYGDDGAGIHFISRSPFLTISWGPRSRFIVDEGFNFVADRAPRAQAGNFIEFGLPFSESRVSLRIFSLSWARYDYDGWRSNHYTADPGHVFPAEIPGLQKSLSPVFDLTSVPTGREEDFYRVLSVFSESREPSELVTRAEFRSESETRLSFSGSDLHDGGLAVLTKLSGKWTMYKEYHR